MKNKTRFLARTWFVAATLVAASSATAYPDKPVRVIVPQAAGSSFDSVVRLVSQRLTERWNKQVVVDNRPGANGIIGLEAGAKANADGYTVITGAISHLSVNPSVYKNLPYRPLEDFDPVTQLVSITFLVVAHPSFAGNSVKNLVALAKSKPPIQTIVLLLESAISLRTDSISLRTDSMSFFTS